MEIPINRLKRALQRGPAADRPLEQPRRATSPSRSSRAPDSTGCCSTPSTRRTSCTMVHSQLQAMEGGTASAVVRPAWNDAVILKRLLDIGVQSFLVPFVQNADEAPPRGGRDALSARRHPRRRGHDAREPLRAQCRTTPRRANDGDLRDRAARDPRARSRTSRRSRRSTASTGCSSARAIWRRTSAISATTVIRTSAPTIEDAIARIVQAGQDRRHPGAGRSRCAALARARLPFVAVGSDVGILLARQSEALAATVQARPERGADVSDIRSFASSRRFARSRGGSCRSSSRSTSSPTSIAPTSRSPRSAMNRDLGFYAVHLRLGRRDVLHRLLLLRSAEQRDPAARRRAHLDRAHHGHVGHRVRPDDVRDRHDELLRDPLPARRRPRPDSFPARCSTSPTGSRPAYRARVISALFLAVPGSNAVAAALSGALLQLDGVWGLAGWQWMFLLESLPAVLLAPVVLLVLTDRPATRRGSRQTSGTWLESELSAERRVDRTQRPHDAVEGADRPSRPRPVARVSHDRHGDVRRHVLPAAHRQGHGLSNVATGLVTAVPYTVGALGMLLWAQSSDRHHERRWHFIVGALLAAAGLVVAGATGEPLLSRWSRCRSRRLACTDRSRRSGRCRRRFSAAPRPPAALRWSTRSAISAALPVPMSSVGFGRRRIATRPGSTFSPGAHWRRR